MWAYFAMEGEKSSCLLYTSLPHCILVLVCIIGAALAQVRGTLFLQTLIDDYITPMIGSPDPDFGPLAAALLQIVGVYAFGILCSFLFTRVMEMCIRDRAEGMLAFNNPAMMLAMYGCILSLSWFGAQMITVGSLTTGELTSLFSYVMNILMSLMMLSMVFVMITMSVASMHRIAEVINENPDIQSPTEAVSYTHLCFGHQQ